MIWYLTWVSIGLLSMSINGILMGDCCAFIIISKFIFWWVRKNCFAIKSINAAAIKWKRESNSAAPSLVLAAYTSWVSHSRMMRPLYALAVKRTSEFFLKILDCRRTRASKKQKKHLLFLMSSAYGSPQNKTCAFYAKTIGRTRAKNHSPSFHFLWKRWLGTFYFVLSSPLFEPLVGPGQLHTCRRFITSKPTESQEQVPWWKNV